MRKKIFFIFFILILGLNPLQAQARKISLMTVDRFNSQYPKREYSIVAAEDILFKDKQKIEKGSLITGTVTKVVPAKRLKRNAYIIFNANTFTVPSQNNKLLVLGHPLKLKIKQPKHHNAGEIATNAAATALSFIPPFTIIVPVVQFGIGAAHPGDDEGRFQSGCRYIVESWPICYCLKGDEMQMERGTLLKVSLKNKKLGKTEEVLLENDEVEQEQNN